MSRVSSTQGNAWPVSQEEEVVVAQPSFGRRVWAFLTGPYPTLVSRFVLGVIFFISGIAKLGVPATLAASIRDYEMGLPNDLIQFMAVWMPIVEIAVAVFLLAGLFTRFAAAITTFMLLVFLVAIGWAWAHGLSVNCGCFGGAQANPIGLAIIGALGPIGTWLSNETAGPESFLRDVVFLVMAVNLMFVPTIFSLDSLRRRGQDAEVEEYDEDEPEVAEAEA